MIPTAANGTPAPQPESASPARTRSRRPRLTVVEAVYHQPPDGRATYCESRFARWLDSDEQPFERRLVVGPDWMPLEAGWVKEACALTLTNQEGSGLQVQPSRSQRADIDARVIEVSLRGPGPADVLVRPGESCRLEPADLGRVFLRCTGGEGKARAILFLFPR